MTLPNGLPDSAWFALHRYDGAWHVTDVGSAFFTCSMPKRVRHDLGFTERCPPVGVTG